MKEFGLFINGQWEAAQGGRTAPTINPATGEPWATVAAAGTADVDSAVAAAKAAHESGAWRNKSREERGAIISRIGAIISERAEELAFAEVADAGGTMRKANIADIPATSQTFSYYGDLVSTSADEEEFEDFAPVASKNIVRKEPVGVCGLIVPFNFPMAAASWKLAPALAAGNTMVLKPSPYTPVTALMLGEICKQAGVPDGVVNVVTGQGPEIGEALVAHADVDKIAFTGSTPVGKRIMETAAKTLKKLTLELGGKSPNIVLDDANLDCAVRGALFGTFFHSGQVCESGTRLLVHASIHDEFVEKLVAGASQILVGDPMDMATMMGPLVSERQRENTERYVRLGREEGAECVFGGKRPENLQKGYYHQPTIFDRVSNDMKIAREEIFGPVVSVIRFHDDEEALRIANDTLYGLGAAVWSRNIDRARAMANRIDAGTVWINDYHLINVRFPFGGYKQSGFGRELGPWGLSEFQQLKHIHVGEAVDAADKYYFNLLLD